MFLASIKQDALTINRTAHPGVQLLATQRKASYDLEKFAGEVRRLLKSLQLEGGIELKKREFGYSIQTHEAGLDWWALHITNKAVKVAEAPQTFRDYREGFLSEAEAAEIMAEFERERVRDPRAK